MNLLRAFIAIELSEQLQDALEKQTTRLRQSLGDELIRWIPTQNMHLTLKFIGNIAASHVEFSQADFSNSRFTLRNLICKSAASAPSQARSSHVFYGQVSTPRQILPTYKKASKQVRPASGMRKKKSHFLLI
jgi:2'-5' RNA ligase